jgi:hypothetical protein
MSEANLSSQVRALPGAGFFPVRYTFIQLALGALLVVAAFLKARQLIVANDWTWLQAAWLISGLVPRISWWVSAFTFIALGTFALFKTISGEADCGCFGAVRSPPWVAAVVDVLALLRAK